MHFPARVMRPRPVVYLLYMAQASKRNLFAQDLTIIGISIVVAVTLVKTGALHSILASAQGWQFLGSFLAGIFFTSVFTAAPAVAAISELAVISDPLHVALIGALGSVVGDLLIYRFIQDRFSKHLLEATSDHTFGKRIQQLLQLKLFRWLSFIVGIIIIASPLPDELGISLLGFSQIKTTWFIPLTYVLNGIGIFVIGLLARAL